MAFVEDNRYESHHPDCSKGPGNHPVVMVSWFDALAYCKWLTEKLGEWARTQLSDSSIPAGSLLERMCRGLVEGDLVATLPSEAEWEKAAKGTSGRTINPWGDESDPERANYHDTGIAETSSVGCFPSGASPHGCEEMAGNVWEWTRSLWGKSFDNDYGYPYDIANGREDLNASEASPRVVRGGSFADFRNLVRVACRLRPDPRRRIVYIGFRVAVAPFTSGL